MVDGPGVMVGIGGYMSAGPKADDEDGVFRS